MHGTDAGRSKVRGPGVTRGNSMYGSREVREEQEVREERVRVRYKSRGPAPSPPRPPPALMVLNNLIIKILAGNYVQISLSKIIRKVLL